MLGGLRATPDLIAPSLARSVAGSQYSLNNNAIINTSSLFSGGNLSSSGLNLHLLQQQLHQQQQQTQAAAISASHSVNPSLQELTSSFGSTSGGAGVKGGIGASSTRLDTSSLLNQHLPNVSIGSLPLQNSSAEQDQLKSMLPAYRQAPDYTTAVQIKYGAVGDSSSEALYENQRKVSVDVRINRKF